MRRFDVEVRLICETNHESKEDSIAWDMENGDVQITTWEVSIELEVHDVRPEKEIDDSGIRETNKEI